MAVEIPFVKDLLDPANQRLRRNVVFTNRCVQSIKVAVVHRRCNSSQSIPFKSFFDRQAGLSEFPDQIVVTSLDCFSSTLLGVPVPNLVGRPV